MRIVCVWRDQSDYGRMVEEWLTEFERRNDFEIESLDPDTGEGESFCRAYDVVQYPTMVAVSEDGTARAMWQGKDLPTFDEVGYWARA